MRLRRSECCGMRREIPWRKPTCQQGVLLQVNCDAYAAICCILQISSKKGFHEFWTATVWQRDLTVLPEAENHGNMLAVEPWLPNQHAPLHLTPGDTRCNTRLRTQDSRRVGLVLVVEIRAPIIVISIVFFVSKSNLA